jgi:hypothetical protein
MARLYKWVRIEIDDFNKIKNKKELLNKDVNNLIGKDIKFPMTKFFKAMANGVLEINPNETVQYFKLKRLKI